MVRGNYKTIKELAKTALDANLSVLVLGHPGVGKSTLARELAQEYGLELIDIRLAHVEPSELVGVQLPDRETGKLVTYVPEWVPKDKPAFIFLDEFNAGVSKLHQAAAYQIVLDRRAGKVKFHPETKIMAAGNLEEDNAIVTPLSQALNNRFVHFILEPDVECWLEWAKHAGISPVMRAYIHFRGIRGLYNNPGDTPAFPSPRTIEWADRLYQIAKKQKTKKEKIKALIASCIGEGDAVQFMQFESLYSQIDIQRVIQTGEIGTEDKHREPSFLYALTYGVASYVREKLEPAKVKEFSSGIVKFLKQINSEYVVLFLREIMDKTKTFRVLVDVITKDRDLAKMIDSIIEGINMYD